MVLPRGDGGEDSALFEKAKRIAEGAAIMTDTSYSVNVLSAVWPTRANRTLAEVIQSNIEADRHAAVDRGRAGA